MPQRMPDGRWRARVRLNGRLTSLGVYERKRDADRAEREAKVATDQGRFIDLRSNLTVAEFARSYVEARI